jgi:hypothetical protein
MKTTLMFRQIANPRRTTLAHLTDASELTAVEVPEGTVAAAEELPPRTANPRRTVLTELPKAPVAP